MTVLDKEVIRLVESLDEFEHVSVTDIGRWVQAPSRPPTAR